MDPGETLSASRSRRRSLVLELLEGYRLGQLGRRNAEVDEPVRVQTLSATDYDGNRSERRAETHLLKALEKSEKKASSSLAYF